jgi:YVTN family beta-propeller protein
MVMSSVGIRRRGLSPGNALLLMFLASCGSGSGTNGAGSPDGGGMADGPGTSMDSGTSPESGGGAEGGSDGGPQGDGASGGFSGAVLYIASDGGNIDAFQVGTWAAVGHWSGLALTDGVRGIDADPVGGILYVAHGGDDLGSSGGLLAWSLTTHQVVYDKTYNHGIDQLAFGGGRIYMPAGELANTTTWYVLSAADGSQLSTEQGGSYPHNTIYQNGHRYYGGRQSNSLVVLGIGAGSVGPSPSSQTGVRPFTVNAAETRVWITWTGYRGFSVGNVQTGALVTSVDFGSVPGNYTPTAASHGITLAPDGSEIYVLDTPNNAVRAYDGTDNPALIATVNLTHPIFPGNESPCAYDCLRDGWLLHSYDGHYVYVGDSGDVIDTKTHQVAANVPALANSRHGYVEVDWANGKPVTTTTHFGRSR